MRALAAALAVSVVVACTGAAISPAAQDADVSVFGGLGTWVDIYDGAVYAAPEKTAQRIAARGVTTVWAETANDRAAADVVNPVELGRLVEALHARGVRVVAWYLPGHVKPALDTRRALAMLSFSTPTGEAFDGIGLDIESTRLINVGLRSRRAVALARRLRQEAGERAKLGSDVTPHVLRRTLGTALSEAGVPVAVAASILGH